MTENTRQLQRLPVSTQEFTVVRDNNLVYIDKTDLVWEMANAPEDVVFFSRPRRFGKTMLVSTLEAYFQGKKEYFEGLKIMELERDWKEYVVLRFDLSGSVLASTMRDSLHSQLKDYEKLYGVVPTTDSPGVRFRELINVASGGERKVVCLFDEYDYPLQHTLFHREEEHERLKDLYREFFAVLKSQSRYIKFIFITGITKFTGLSLFSVMNNICNLSFDARYQSLTGVTKEELRGVLLPHVEALAQKDGVSVEDELLAIKQKYDGYRFSRAMLDIYNPYSVVRALNNQALDDYWSQTSNSQMLMDAVDKIGWDGGDFDGIEIDRRVLESNDIDRKRLPLFLYQAGYLTIKGFDEDTYTLGIPNTETRNAVYTSILPRLAEKDEIEVESSIAGIRKALKRLDIETAFAHLRALVAETPYSRDNSVPAVEEKFQFILRNALFLCNARMQEEVRIATGRIDLVAEHPKCILVMELKMTARGGADAAASQIEDRDYLAPYLMKQKPVYTVAIEFNGETRKMGEVAVVRNKE